MISPKSFLVVVALVASLSNGRSDEPKFATGENIKLQVTSTAFLEGQAVPQKYTCLANNISPPLAWTPPPSGTKSIALICEDVDAPGGTFTHWMMYEMPPAEIVLAENIAKVETLDDGRKQGKNSFGKTGYSGPCPPQGKPHRYYFKVYALDIQLDLPGGAAKKDLVAAMDKHVIAEGQLMGTFGR